MNPTPATEGSARHTEARRVAVISAGLRQPSSTRLLADRLGAATRAALESHGEDVEVVTVDLRVHAHAITDHLLTGFAPEPLASALKEVTSADAVIAVTPVFGASYSGLFKSFVDVLEPDSLRGRPVLVAATGGTERHSLVLDHALRPLFAYLGALVVPTGVYAATSDWGSQGDGPLADSSLASRVDRAAGELADIVRSRPAVREHDPFELTTDFADLLG